jgi:malonyl-CoA O-methyltransferase
MPRPPAGRSATPLTSEQAYDRLASAYPPHAHNLMMEMEQAAVVALLGDVAGRRCLDLGCGSGRYLRLLREAGAARALGLDLSAAMLSRARAGGFGVARGDAVRLPFADAAFDVVVCGLMVGHVAALFELLAEVSRVLAVGGVLVYSDVHPAGTLAGWERALPDAEGRVVTVFQHLHLYADHVAACRAAGLAIEALEEPRVEASSPWRGWPAVLAVRAVRGSPESPR